jgi:hypothetical protein
MTRKFYRNAHERDVMQDMAQAKLTRCNHMFHAICLRKWLYMQVRYSSEWFLRVSVTIQCCGTLEPEPKEPKLFASGSGSTCR